MMQNAHLIYNPNAGRLAAPPLISQAARVLERYGWNIHIEKTQSGAHTTELARRAAEMDQDALIVAGGDGSLENAIAGLLGSQTALGVLPVGTANVWARELGLPIPNLTHWNALETCAHALATAEIRAVDVGLCNRVPFLLWAGVGLDAYIVHNIEPRKRWEKFLGMTYYAGSAILRATAWKGMTLMVQFGERKLTGHFILGIVSNIRLYAGGLTKLSPKARLDDGVMELWLFRGRSLPTALRHLLDLWSGQHINSKQVSQHSIHQLTIQSEQPLFVHLDGEPSGIERCLDIVVEKRALRTLTPSQTSPKLFSNPETH